MRQILIFEIVLEGKKECLLTKHTLKCLSIGVPNTTAFPFVPNGKWWLSGVPIIEHIIIRL